MNETKENWKKLLDMFLEPWVVPGTKHEIKGTAFAISLELFIRELLSKQREEIMGDFEDWFYQTDETFESFKNKLLKPKTRKE